MFSLRVLMLADPRCHRGVHAFGNAGFWKRVAWFSLLWPTLLETKEYHLFPCMDVPIGMNTLDAPMPLTHVLEPSYSTPECSPARWLGGRLPVRFGCKGSQQSRHGHVPETRKQTTTRAATEHSFTVVWGGMCVHICGHICESVICGRLLCGAYAVIYANQCAWVYASELWWR